MLVCRPSAFPSAPARPRRGFTLLELLLVLSVLASLFAIAWPGLQNVYGTQQLRNATEKVRIELAGCRLKAIDSGLTYQFRYEPGGRWFIVLPAETDPDVDLNDATGNQQSQASRYPTVTGRLPDKFKFQTAGGQNNSVERLPQEWLSMLSNSGQLSQVSWSAAVLFEPDGSATPGVVMVVDPEQHSIRLTVRELTGTVVVDSIRREGV